MRSECSPLTCSSCAVGLKPKTRFFPWASAPTCLLRDNDRACGHDLTSCVRAMCIHDRPISLRLPWQNGIAERLIGTLRSECLDRMLIFGEAHLRRTPSYAAYYKQARTHLALQKDAPPHSAVQRSGAIVGVPISAGLHPNTFGYDFRKGQGRQETIFGRQRRMGKDCPGGTRFAADCVVGPAGLEPATRPL